MNTTLILCIAISVSVFAQDEQEYIFPPSIEEGLETDPAAPEPDPRSAEQGMTLGEDVPGIGAPVASTSGWAVFRVILTLAVVAVAIYGLVYFIKRASRGRVTQDPFLKVLASMPLGTTRSVHVISVGLRAWLVGTAENGVNVISEIDDKEILDEMFLEESRKSAEAASGRLMDFKALLRKMGVPAESDAPGPDKIRNRTNRLKGK